MANPNPKNKFKKGVSGNPGGRKKINPLISEFKKTSYEDFITQLQKYGSLSKDEMQQDIARKDATMFEIIFGRIIIDAAKGEKDARNCLLERLWGKAKDKAEHSTDTNAPRIIVQLPDNGRSAPELPSPEEPHTLETGHEG
jgi:hypothetical protein